MNIFKILSDGDGSIKEPNVSAFLAYLLDPSQGHGLGSKFLERFIKPLVWSEKNEKFNLLRNVHGQRVIDLSIKSRYDINIVTEKIVTLPNNRRRDIDILIEIYDSETNECIFTICVENKIKEGAINYDQLKEEIIGINNYYDTEVTESNKPQIGFIFITPIDSKNAKNAFDNFEKNQDVVDLGISAHHLIWKPTEQDDSIFYQLSSLLEFENKGLIDPIQEYTKHTLKSFLNFIITDFKSYQEEKFETDKYKRKRLSESEYWKLNEGRNTVTIAKKIKKWVETKIGNRAEIRYSPTHMSIYMNEVKQHSKQGVFLQVTLKNSNTKLTLHLRRNPNIPFDIYLNDFFKICSIDIKNHVEEKRPGVFDYVISNDHQYDEVGEKLIEFSYNQILNN